MPYLYLTVEPVWSAVASAMAPYLERSGINLRLQMPPAGAVQDAIRLVLHRRPRAALGAAIYYTPMGASVRFSFCLNHSLRQLPPLSSRVYSRAGAIGGRLYPTGVATVLTAFGSPDSLAADAVARALAQATANHFRMPTLSAQPEQPASLRHCAPALLLRFPNAQSNGYHTIAAGEDLSVLGAYGPYFLVRHRETVGFLPQEQVSLART